MLDDLLPVEMAVLGVDHDPIEPEAHRHLGHTGRFQGDPQAVHRLTGGKLFSKFADRERVHTEASISGRGAVARPAAVGHYKGDVDASPRCDSPNEPPPVRRKWTTTTTRRPVRRRRNGRQTTFSIAGNDRWWPTNTSATRSRTFPKGSKSPSGKPYPASGSAWSRS